MKNINTSNTVMQNTSAMSGTQPTDSTSSLLKNQKNGPPAGGRPTGIGLHSKDTQVDQVNPMSFVGEMASNMVAFSYQREKEASK